ncbi:hypothetical protein D3C72_1931930 [compost metagenome]
MLGAEVHHFLGFGHAADRRASQVLATEDHAATGQRRVQFGQHADQAHGGLTLEQAHVRVGVMADRDGVEQEVEAARVCLHLRGIARDQHFVGAQALGVGTLFRGGGDHHHVRAECLGELHAHVAQATQTDHADLLARADLPVAQR